MLLDKIPVSSYVATNSNTKLGDLALFCIPLFSRTNASALSLDLFCNNVIILMWLQEKVTNVHVRISGYQLGTIHLRRRHLLGGRGKKLAKYADGLTDSIKKLPTGVS